MDAARNGAVDITKALLRALGAQRSLSLEFRDWVREVHLFSQFPHSGRHVSPEWG